MIRFNPALTSLRSSLLLLALVAVILRGLVPMGFMPDLHHEAGTPLVICSGTDIQTIYLDQNGDPAPADTAHDTSSACVFAFAPLAFEPVLPEIVQVEFEISVVPVAVILATSVPSFELRPYSSRAPPASIA